MGKKKHCGWRARPPFARHVVCFWILQHSTGRRLDSQAKAGHASGRRTDPRQSFFTANHRASILSGAVNPQKWYTDYAHRHLSREGGPVHQLCRESRDPPPLSFLARTSFYGSEATFSKTRGRPPALTCSRTLDLSSPRGCGPAPTGRLSPTGTERNRASAPASRRGYYQDQTLPPVSWVSCSCPRAAAKLLLPHGAWHSPPTTRAVRPDAGSHTPHPKNTCNDKEEINTWKLHANKAGNYSLKMGAKYSRCLL